MKNFNGKVAAITGAGSGIGYALALELASEGADLALSDINEAGLKQTAADCESLGAKVTTQILDVSDLNQMREWATKVVADFGKVNLIFNNAGVALGATVEGMEYKDLEWLMGINFWGVVYGTKEFLPHLKASGDGHVINISSLFGLMAQPTQSAYNAAKFAVRGFTEALIQELEMEKAPVGALCVHPGGIKTNIAKAAKTSDSISQLGMDPATSTKRFDKLLRKPPKEAAQEILAAVKSGHRRVLVGSDAKALDKLQRIAPTGYQKLSAFFAQRMNK